MIAEIAAANAAFQVIKGALANGKELYDVAEQATKYFDSKSEIIKKANKGGNKTELQCFMELERIKEQEAWLKEYMIYAGRADMHSDWLQFQADCKRNRQEQERKARKKRAERIDLLKKILTYGLIAFGCFPVILVLLLKLFGVM